MQHHFHEVLTSLGRLAVALALTSLNYIVLTGYDFPAFRYIQHPLPCSRIALAGGIFLLEPSLSLTFPFFLSVFLLVQVSGLVNQVRGGLGIFESVIVIGLSSALSSYSVLASLVAYPVI